MLPSKDFHRRTGNSNAQFLLDIAYRPLYMQSSIQLGCSLHAVALDRHSVVPLYYQIQQHLLDQIRSGSLKAGQPVPSEQEISVRMRVSRMTARQALKSLCSLGVAYSQRGKGTFVSRIKLEKDFRQVLSFSEEMCARGARPRSRVLAFRRIQPDSEVAEALHVASSEPVFLLRRVRLADSVSLCVECTHVPVRLCPNLQETFDPGGSLYQSLLEHYGIRIDFADEVAEASLASPEEARLLRIRRKAPVFRFTRTAYLHSGEPVEFVKSVYRGDRCKVVSRLSRRVKLAEGGATDVIFVGHPPASR
jgi:GntR family transcriptional regulator